jgi:hypothetical protein
MAEEENQQITSTSVVVADSRQVSAEMADETLILHCETGGYYSLDKVAARIWQLLQSPVAVSEVAEVLSKDYDTPKERCEADLLELLHELAKRGLLRVLPEADA